MSVAHKEWKKKISKGAKRQVKKRLKAIRKNRNKEKEGIYV